MFQNRIAKLLRTEPPRIKIKFPFDKEDLKRVKLLIGRRMASNKRYWICTLNRLNIKKLDEWGFYIHSSIRAAVKKLRGIKHLKPIEVPGFGKTLRPFQKIGVAFIEQKNGRALIGDEMGLGKTIQALAWIQLHRDLRPAVIIVPGNLKPNWEREVKACIPHPHVQTIYGTNTDQRLRGEIIIINYDILPNDYKENPNDKKRPKEIPYTGWVDFIIGLKPKVLIIDECHYLIHPTAQRTKAVKKLSRHIPHIIGLSGTPAKNRAHELDTIVRIIDPNALPPFWHYNKETGEWDGAAQIYYGYQETPFGWRIGTPKRKKELHRLLTETVMIRRKKADVLTELPAKVRSLVPLEISNREDYASVEKQFIKWVIETKGEQAGKKAERAEQLARIEALKQLAVTGKLRACSEWIKNFLQTEDKLLVFCTHTKTIDRMMKIFGRSAVRYDGTISNLKRDFNLNLFQTDKAIRLMFGMIDKSGQPAGIGITATAAAAAAFIELQDSPGIHDQAEDRIHRITQTRGVNIYYLLGMNTIEERIAKLLDKKRKELSEILDGKKVKSKMLLTELIRQMIKERKHA